MFVCLFGGNGSKLTFQKGFLYLTTSERLTHSVRTLHVTVPSSSAECLGDILLQWTLGHMVGYDVVVLNWLLGLHGGDGFIYDTQTRELSDLGYAKDLLVGHGSDLVEQQFQKTILQTQTLIHLKLLDFKIAILATTLFLPPSILSCS